MDRSICWNLIFASLLLTAVVRSESIYLFSTDGVVTNDHHLGGAEARGMNEAGIIVGWCAPTSTDFTGCYWDTNETPFTYTSGTVSVSALRSHLFDGPNLPYLPFGGQLQMLLDIDDAGTVLGFPGHDGALGPQSYYTAQLPDFTGWTLFPSVDCCNFDSPSAWRPPSEWTHTPSLSNANWIVTNGTPNPIGEGHSIPQLNRVSDSEAVPEPGTLGVVLIGLAMLARCVLAR